MGHGVKLLRPEHTLLAASPSLQSPHSAFMLTKECLLPEIPASVPAEPSCAQRSSSPQNFLLLQHTRSKMSAGFSQGHWDANESGYLKSLQLILLSQGSTGLLLLLSPCSIAAEMRNVEIHSKTAAVSSLPPSTRFCTSDNQGFSSPWFCWEPALRNRYSASSLWDWAAKGLLGGTIGKEEPRKDCWYA